MAQSTVPDLMASPGVDRVGIAGRSEAKAKAFAAAQRDPRAVPVPLDARDSPSLVREMKGWDCVINSSWYDLNVSIMEAAIEAGIHYCDLGGLYHQTLRQLKLDVRAKDAGVTCVLGIGSTPGTMNVMGAYGASKLDKVHKVLLRSSGAVVSGGEPGIFIPPYAIRTIFDEFSMDAPILRKVKIQFVAGLPKPKEPELDVDIQRCLLIGERDGNPVTLRYEAVTWPHKKWNVGGGVVDTGVPPSIAAQWMLEGRTKGPGVLPPEIAIEPVAYFTELSARGRGIRVMEIAEETRTLN